MKDRCGRVVGMHVPVPNSGWACLGGEPAGERVNGNDIVRNVIAELQRKGLM